MGNWEQKKERESAWQSICALRPSVHLQDKWLHQKSSILSNYQRQTRPKHQHKPPPRLTPVTLRSDITLSLSLSKADSWGSDGLWEHKSLSVMLYVRREGYWLEGDKVIAGMTWILYLLCSFPPSSFTPCLFVPPLPFLFPRQPGWWWHHIHMSAWGERQKEIDVFRCVWENKTGWRREKATRKRGQNTADIKYALCYFYLRFYKLKYNN